MARVEKTVHVCDRCAFGQEKPATTERTFALEDRYYKLDLCEQHATMFDRDLGGWTRLAAEVEGPGARQRSVFFTAERRAETVRLRELMERQQREAAAVAAAELRRREIEAAEAAQSAAEQTAQQRLDRAAAALAVHETHRIAREASLPADDEPTLEEKRFIEEQEAWALVPNAPGWRLTVHARERMWERGFTPVQVLNAAANPEIMRDNWQATGMPYRKGLRVHQSGDCQVVVNPAKKSVITVLDRNAQQMHDQEMHDQAERNAL